ncbi:STAS domain-containing protein [Jeotgalibacillus sp. ET6]|uniref:STAS domain-containing protein n=1 Tax=Jeotgalibacillus sp. ET6 TaxID=3037260 RepID=UPI002418A1A7|nr:STAS domain-containing protein [Jeotgalibacillus sp. ET6]MDG5473894.1 STAS domain-containing protein [Jeotgalibacillus sp. ET6]
MSKLNNVADYFANHATVLAEELVEFSLRQVTVNIPEVLIMKARTMQQSFFIFFAEAILEENEKIMLEKFKTWNKEFSENQQIIYDQLSSLVKPFAENRLYFSKKVTAICFMHDLSTEETLEVVNRLHYLLDTRLAQSILEYERYKNEINHQNRKEIIELAAPVVPLQHDIAILPLVGSIDQDRAEQIMTKAVPKISSLNIDCLIIDFSGIHKIDTEVAAHIFTITSVLDLLGIQVNITGLRPELAQSIVLSGISFSGLKTYSTVKQAMDTWTNAVRI